MRKLIGVLSILTVLSATALTASAQSSQATQAAQAAQKSDTADIGYALGIAIGTNLKKVGVVFDYDTFLEAVRDMVENRPAKMTAEKADEMIQLALSEVRGQKTKDNEANGIAFLEKNAQKTGIAVTSSGLQYEVLKKGTGAKPTPTDSVKIHYTGTLIDGTKFDSSLDRGEPAVLALDQVIPGFSEGLRLMPVGSKYRLFIPAVLGYGTDGTGGTIGPNSALIFEVELFSIEPKKK
jgi:FKBP-type peptidyl-prolyl cis-trans isomerase